MNEREIIQLLHDATGANADDLVRGIGDDCAVIVKNPGMYWLVTTDTLVESVHFDTHWHPAEKIGRKAVAVNVSDIAAMGGTPQFIFLSLALPTHFREGWLREFSKGFRDSCREYGCILAGGDTVRCSDSIVMTITVIGEVESDRVLYRSDAEPGDEIWVSGFLGQAAAGLELCRSGIDYADKPFVQPLVESHLNPHPQVQLGRMLAGCGFVHAMMDLSDGLSTDLAHICEQSGVGAVIDPDRLPKSTPLQQAAPLLDPDSMDLMIAGGEDYELIFTASRNCHPQLDTMARESSCRLSCIGEITGGQGVKILKHVSGEEEPQLIDVSFSGYDHFRSSR